MLKIIDLGFFKFRNRIDLSCFQDVTILIKTLERKTHLIKLLHSLFDLGFKGPVIIADDSKVTYKKDILNIFHNQNIEYITLPYDSGTSLGRNEMLARVKTDYFVLCDDDFILDSRSDLLGMMKLLEANQLDLLGGVFFQYNRKTRVGRLLDSVTKYFFNLGLLIPPFSFYEYYADFVIKGDVIHFSRKPYSGSFLICDLTHNFFIARTESVVKMGGWNPELKGGEHQNFFIRAKLSGLRVATTRKYGVTHDRWTPNSNEYLMLRNRGSEYQNIALREFGISRIENFSKALGESFGK